MKTITPGEIITNVSATVLNCIESLATSCTPATLDNCLPDLAQAAEQLRTLQARHSHKSPYEPTPDLRHNIAVLQSLLHHAAEFYRHRASHHSQATGGYFPGVPSSAILTDPTVVIES